MDGPLTAGKGCVCFLTRARATTATLPAGCSVEGVPVKVLCVELLGNRFLRRCACECRRTASRRTKDEGTYVMASTSSLEHDTRIRKAMPCARDRGRQSHIAHACVVWPAGCECCNACRSWVEVPTHKGQLVGTVRCVVPCFGIQQAGHGFVGYRWSGQSCG